MIAQLQILKDVETALAANSAGTRNMLLRHVTDLFVVGSEQYSDDEIDLFDDVFNRLVTEIETSARALLAIRLAPVPQAPPKIIRTLAFDDDIEVAAPVLSLSQRLDEPTLVENAKKKGQEHLLAISRRQSLGERLTDVLIARGDRQVVLSTADNPGARFSESGFNILIQRSTEDDTLAACVGARPDIPPALFQKLLRKASQHVRARLEAEHPHAKLIVREVIDNVTDHIRTQAAEPKPAREPPVSIKILHQSGQLDERALRAFADSGLVEETAGALALMCNLPMSFVEQMMAEEHPETLLVLARAIGLSWPSTKAILQSRSGKRPMSADEIAQCLASFERLKRNTAQEIVSFYQVREQTGPRQSP
jgi:uncharacterized protein (DUF2336 family)